MHYLQTPITIISNNYLNNNVSLSQVRSRHQVRRNETDREHADEPIITQIDSRKVEFSKITLKELDLLSTMGYIYSGCH